MTYYGRDQDIKEHIFSRADHHQSLQGYGY